MSEATCLSSAVCFQGLVQKWEHKSSVLGETCDRMKFSVFVPSSATAEKPAPVVYWLSGLTCNEDNFITKAGAQRVAEELGLVLVCPDTSPRTLAPLPLQCHVPVPPLGTSCAGADDYRWLRHRGRGRLLGLWYR